MGTIKEVELRRSRSIVLTKLYRLSVEADSRYASDAELQFMDDYLRSFDLRLSTYLNLQRVEAELIQEVEGRLRAADPQLLTRGDFSSKWKSDVVRTLRLAAVAMLIDDLERLQERFLFWFQTLMRAFRAQRSCDVTYRLLQEAIRKRLAKEESNLICPILEVTRTMLS